MTWNADWTTGVSETISQIESQATSIADLQHEITQAGTPTLPALAATDFAYQFCKLMAYGKASSSASQLILSCNGIQLFSLTVGASQTFYFEVHFFYDPSTGNLPMQPISPRIDSSSNFVNANISGAPSTLQFALSNDSGSVAVSYFAAMQMF
jgi:hypothetical protein